MSELRFVELSDADDARKSDRYALLIARAGEWAEWWGKSYPTVRVLDGVRRAGFKFEGRQVNGRYYVRAVKADALANHATGGKSK